MPAMYSKIAPIIRSLGNARDHFTQQAAILSDIIQANINGVSFGRELRLLDLACGTGDVAHLIAGKFGNSEILACDTSKEMLLEANSLAQRNNLKLHHSDWSEAERIFETYGTFHYAWIMGNSLAHWNLENLSRLFQVLSCQGLKKGGMFICDLRRWDNADPRSIGSWRDLGRYTTSSGQSCLLRDRATTTGNVQNVEYEAEFDEDKIFFTLTYNVFSQEQLRNMLDQNGFSTEIFSGTISYPYEVVLAYLK